MPPGACRTPSGKFPFLKVGEMAEAENGKAPKGVTFQGLSVVPQQGFEPRTY